MQIRTFVTRNRCGLFPREVAKKPGNMPRDDLSPCDSLEITLNVITRRPLRMKIFCEREKAIYIYIHIVYPRVSASAKRRPRGVADARPGKNKKMIDRRSSDEPPEAHRIGAVWIVSIRTRCALGES